MSADGKRVGWSAETKLLVWGTVLSLICSIVGVVLLVNGLEIGE